MAAEVPLQANFLTGEFVDKRTRQQKQRDKEHERPTQIEMFSQREVAQFGVRANPQLSLSEHTKLVLIADDPRTPEAIEWEQMQAAQALTKPLFAELLAESAPETVMPPPAPEKSETISPPLDLHIQSELGSEPDEADDEQVAHVPSSKRTKIEVYTQLVRIAAEQAATLYASPTIAIAQAINLAVAQSEAKHAGLTEQEVQTAIKIGEFRGKVEKPVPIQPNPAPFTATSQMPIYGVLWVHGRATQPMEMVY